MSETIIIRQLPHEETSVAGDIVQLPMTAHDRRRVRRLVDAPDGARLALELATGTCCCRDKYFTESARVLTWSQRRSKRCWSYDRERWRKRRASDT